MASIAKNIEVPVILNGRTVDTATFTVMATKFPNMVIARVSYGEKFIGEHPPFKAGTSFETVIATVRNLLTPQPSVRHS